LNSEQGSGRTGHGSLGASQLRCLMPPQVCPPRGGAEEPPVLAPLPETLRERGIAAPGLLAAGIVGKYVDHLPLYRQEDIFRRHDQTPLPRAPAWPGGWDLAADWLQPILRVDPHRSHGRRLRAS